MKQAQKKNIFLIVLICIAVLVGIRIIFDLAHNQQAPWYLPNIPGGEKIYFDPNALNALNGFYGNHTVSGFKVCLTGFTKLNGNTTGYYISSFYEPKMTLGSQLSLRLENCNESTMIDVHSYPYRACPLYDVPAFSYENYLKYNYTVIEGVMCDVGRFNFYVLR